MFIDEIRRLYCEEKLSTNQIGERYLTSGENIRVQLKKAGVKMRDKGTRAAEIWSAENKARIKELCDQGVKPKVIIYELNLPCAVQTMRYRLRQWGFHDAGQRRTKSAPEALALSTATREAKAFRHETLISFPESPRLEMEWRHVLADVRAERGAQ